MKVCLISPFFLLNPDISRPAFIRKVLMDSGIDTYTITSGFSHQMKQIVDFDSENILTIKTLKYKSNKSPIRFVSHFLLALSFFVQAYKLREKYDVFYITAPFALTGLLVKLFIRKKIVIDIVDFWPESLPFKSTLVTKAFLFPWRLLNKFAFNISDQVISLSSNFIASAGLTDKAEQILLGSKSNFTPQRVSDGVLSIFYIGNVGTLYDFETLLLAIESYAGEVNLEIVGNGDRVEWLLQSLENIKINYHYHGVVYDQSIVFDIAAKCDVGFNGYVNTNASFSYKASSYFKYGLPIINSMAGDLNMIVTQYGVGENYIGGDIQSLLRAMRGVESSKRRLKKHVVSYFNLNLDEKLVSSKVLKVFKDLN